MSGIALRSRLHPVARALIVVAATLGLYWPALRAGFVGDDFMILHRLRDVAEPLDVLRFFRGEFFEYYRPLGFVSHAMDWAVAGADARQFHFTNLLLHAASAVLVLLIGRALSPGSIAGPVAGLLFALHASNHEAVVWISARFDLLATCLSLAALWWMVRGGAGSRIAPPLLFLCAVLSKESAVALPVAAAGFAVFRLRAGTAETARRLLPWLVALGLYSALRHLGGGVSAIGGAGRLPKLAALLLMLCVLTMLADSRWLRLRDGLRTHKRRAVGAVMPILGGLVVLAASGGRIGHLAAEKLAVAGFAIFNLASPAVDVFGVPFYLDPDRAMYWLGGVLALAAAAIIIALLCRPLLDDDRLWFLAAFLIATLLPVSALTEGARYLYLPSAPVSLIAGILIADLNGRGRAVAMVVLVAFLVVSAIQISVKVRDWIWAGRMTAEGARLVDAALAPSCGEGRVVMLTAPVGIRGVYTHFYYETFELPRGCMPATFQVLARVVRLDATVDVRWDGLRRIVITAPGYRGNFRLSEDLRHFDRPLREGGAMRLQTAIGELRTDRADGAERLTLTLAPDVDPARTRFFYYSDASIRPLPPQASRYNPRQ